VVRGALIKNGGVRHYLAYHLPAKGLERLKDIGTPSLRMRAQRLAENGYRGLVSATTLLGELLDAVGELEPPPIIWKALETNECFDTREEASRRSREFAGRQDVDLGGIGETIGETRQR